MFGLGTTELIIIAIIVLLLFGAKRLPDIGKGVGGAIREFKKVKHDIKSVGDENTGDQVNKKDDKAASSDPEENTKGTNEKNQ